MTSAAHPAEEETAAPPLVQVLPRGDAIHPDRQEVPATLTSAAVTVAAPFPLTPVPQPEVQLLCPSTLLFLRLTFTVAQTPTLFSCLQGQDFKHDDDLQELLNGQPIMAAPAFTKVELPSMH